MDPESLLHVVELIILTATGAFVVFGFFYSRTQFRLVRASHYIERLNSKDMVETRTAVDGWLHGLRGLSAEEQDERFRALRRSDREKDVAMKNQISLLLNLFTEMAIAYRRGALDDASIESFDYVIPHYLQELRGYIKVVQEEAYPRPVYANLEYMSGVFDRRQPSRVARAALERMRLEREARNPPEEPA